MENFCTILIQSLVLLNEHKDIYSPPFCPSVFRSNLMSATKYTVKNFILHSYCTVVNFYIYICVKFVLFIVLIFYVGELSAKSLTYNM